MFLRRLQLLILFFRNFFEGAYKWIGDDVIDGELYIKYAIRFKMIDKSKPLSFFAENPSEVNKFVREDRDNIMRKVILFQYDNGNDIRIKNKNFNIKNKYIILPILIGLSICAYDFTMFASHRMMNFFSYEMPGGVVSFPLVYFIANIIQEVYGYKRIRQLLWVIIIAQIAILMMSLITLWFLPSHNIPLPLSKLITGMLPQATHEQIYNIYKGFYDFVLGQNIRNVIVNLFAIFIGLFANAYIFANLKKMTKGRMLWFRTIGATCVGEFLFSLVFVFGAFGGQFTNATVMHMQINLLVFKILYEALSIFITYIVCWAIKKVEGIEIIDFSTSFNPFKFWDLEYEEKNYIIRK